MLPYIPGTFWNPTIVMVRDSFQLQKRQTMNVLTSSLCI